MVSVWPTISQSLTEPRVKAEGTQAEDEYRITEQFLVDCWIDGADQSIFGHLYPNEAARIE